MKFKDFPASNQILPTKAGNMPVFIGASGEIISRWQFTWKELWKIILGRSIYITQYPQSIAFPQTEITFRPLSEEEEKEIAAMEARKEEEARKKAVIEDRNKRNPNRLRRLREVAKEQGIVKPEKI